MQCKYYVEGGFSTTQHARHDHTLYVMLFVSLMLHIVLWFELQPGAHTSLTPRTITTLAVTLLESSATPAVSAHSPTRHQHHTATPVVLQPHVQERPPAEASEPPVSSPPANEPVTAQAENAPLQAPHLDAAYLHNPEPTYPLLARRRHLEGTVVIRAQIGTDGRCLHSELHHSSGHAILDQAALDAVAQWRFVPARRGNDAISAWVEVPITFHLTVTR